MLHAGTVATATESAESAESAEPAESPATTRTTRTTEPAGPAGPADRNASGCGQSAGGELYFQRCRWCHTPVFRRSLCPTCASTDLDWERSEGIGVVIRRNAPMAQNRSVVSMAEGFTVVCRVVGSPPEAVSAGVQVRVARAVDPNRQDLPVVELWNPPYEPGYDAR
ncbi:zinc ribbon domain-containing protein [Streptomyces sp. RB6PN25]|uniref:Zinc ribbon domain-containing protein n=1 Tax=Streptomyces humicola TaxID=2953240 RepID=A0ABT1Q4Z1_9ACTN|nr:zinc ribbon domain-containing protein [Streptomyces humicola]MCQ4084400.1 zinc ribbon domain-containing protein [Streptomyces humicola]